MAVVTVHGVGKHEHAPEAPSSSKPPLNACALERLGLGAGAGVGAGRKVVPAANAGLAGRTGQASVETGEQGLPKTWGA